MNIVAEFDQDSNLTFHSDVHLSPSDKDLTTRYIKYLKSCCQHADAVFILGDLFDLWIGPASSADFHELIHCLKSCSQQTKLYFMRGNRDFMLTDAEIIAWGLIPLRDPSIILYAGKRILLTHGDQFCVDDKNYQTFRNIIQHPFTTFFFRSLPHSLFIKISASLKKRSNIAKSKKKLTIMHANHHCIITWLHDYSCQGVIYGHVHQFNHQVYTPSSYDQSDSALDASLDTYDVEKHGSDLFVTVDPSYSSIVCHCLSLDCWQYKPNALSLLPKGYWEHYYLVE